MTHMMVILVSTHCHGLMTMSLTVECERTLSNQHHQDYANIVIGGVVPDRVRS